MSVIQNTKPRPAFRNTGQLARDIGRRRPTVDALTVLTGTHPADGGRCRLYTPDDQAVIEGAAEVYDLCESLDMKGRSELREAWSAYAGRVREIAADQKRMTGPAAAAGDHAVA
jgi:hypothetical protein